MTYTISKSTVECYKLRHQSGMYWADITVDASGKQGRIQIASDYGDWQNFWGACGSSFKKFLTQLNIDYAADKFGADRYFDLNKTLSSYRSAVIEQRKNNSISAETARSIFDECEELEDYIHKDEFVLELWNKKHLLNFFDTPDLSFDITPGFKRFWENVWPVFVEALEKELMENEPAPPSIN